MLPAADCPKVEIPGGEPFFASGFIDVTALWASSSHFSESHSLSHLPLLDPDNNPLAWCAGDPGSGSEMVTIDFGEEVYISGLILRGNNHDEERYKAWVQSLQLEYDNDDGHGQFDEVRSMF